MRLHSPEHQPRHQRTGLRQHRGVVGESSAFRLFRGPPKCSCCATAAAATVRRGMSSRRSFRSGRARLGIGSFIASSPPYCSKYNRIDPSPRSACGTTLSRGYLPNTGDRPVLHRQDRPDYQGSEDRGANPRQGLRDRSQVRSGQDQKDHEDHFQQVPAQVELYSRSQASMRLRDRELIP